MSTISSFKSETTFEFFNGTHLIRVEIADELNDGIRVAMAPANAEGQQIDAFTSDNTKMYGGSWAKLKPQLYGEIIRALLLERQQ